MSGIRPLSTRLPGWPAQAPQYLPDLMQTRHVELKESLLEADVPPALISLVLEMRRDVIDAHHSASDLPITCAQDAQRLLEDRILRTQASKWVAYALGANRLRLAIPHPSGGREYLRVVSHKLPTLEQLSAAPLPPGGTYILIYGGGPEILGARGVAGGIANLRSKLPIADVLFWHLVGKEPPAMYSLAAGCADQAGKRKEFPAQTLMRQAAGEGIS